MVREVINLCVGECGIRLGSQIFTQYAIENKIYGNHQDSKQNLERDENIYTFYEERKNGIWKARGLFFDLEPDIIDEIKSDQHSSIFDDNYILSLNEGGAATHAAGCYYYLLSKYGLEFQTKLNETITSIIEKCDNHQGFIVNRSICGGTGSGMVDSILSDVGDENKKKIYIMPTIFPSINMSQNVIEHYNSMLSIHNLYYHDEDSSCIVYNNQGLYKLYKQNNYHKKDLDFQHLNSIIAQTVSSSIMLSKCNEKVNLNAFSANLIPIPKMKFLVSSYSFYKSNLKEISQFLVNSKNFAVTFEENHVMTNMDIKNDEEMDEKDMMIEIDKLKEEIDKTSLEQQNAEKILQNLYGVSMDNISQENQPKFISLNLMYRGNDTLKYEEIVESVKNSKINFVEWSPNGIKIKCNKNENVSTIKGIMIGNNECIASLIKDIATRYKKCYSNRSFVYWFVANGMEEQEFGEALETLLYILDDYQNL